MVTSFTRIIVTILIAVAGCNMHCYAQADSTDIDDFVAQETVIFYDDFGDDKSNTFPVNWQLSPLNGKPYTSVKMCSVNKDGQQAMVVHAGDANSATGDNMPEPRLKEPDYLPDSFTLQYDFLLSDSATIAVMDLRTTPPLRIPFSIYHQDTSEWTIATTINGEGRTAAMRFEFKERKWHHFAMSYYKQKIVCYIDDEAVLFVQHCDCNPAGFILSAQHAGSVSYANVRIATGKYLAGESYNFGKLFLADKFTTHAIHFDVKKSTIQPGSMLFIRKLAGWLKQNPTVKLEIDGHTDNDGKDADNMKLSQERADAVKAQLVAYGINALRITTKGFGATIPVQPNTTPEGKAYNRRVEFIKK